MTGILQELLRDRAEEVGPPDLDMAAITRRGQSRVRRRRTAWVGGIAAAATVAALTGWAVLPGGNGARDHIVADGTDATPVALSWVTGSTLHRLGEPDVDLGSDVQAWVWAGGSVAYVDDEGKVALAGLDGKQEPWGDIGATRPDDALLVSDGDLVAWVDQHEGYTVVDTTTGERHVLGDARPSRGEPARLTALDGDTAYGVDARGVFSWRIPSNEVTVLDVDRTRTVLDAEDGTTVQREGNRSARVSGPGRDVSLTVDSTANLSPSGALVMAESNDTGLLVDTRTGTEIPLSTHHTWAVPYQWLDDETVAVLAFEGIDQGRGEARSAYLQSCETSTGECEGQGVPIPATYGSVQLPIGVHFQK